MSADGPRGRRLGFGFQQAREAGAPFVTGRSNARINLDQLLNLRPHLRAYVIGELEAGRKASAILKELRDDGHAGNYWVGWFGGEDGEEFLDERYRYTKQDLLSELDWWSSRGVGGTPWVWVRTEDGEWHEVAADAPDEWPA